MNPKNAFWQAFLITIIVFVIGILLGIYVEGSRASKINENSLNSEVNLLDQQLRNNVFSEFNVSCTSAINSTFRFADKIYEDALVLEDYDESSKFTSTLLITHKRYDLLRLMLWSDAISVRKSCKSDFHTIVYFYKYNSQEVSVNSKQKYFADALFELKSKHPDSILLIPIAVNMNLESVDLALAKYDVGEYPIVVIDEEKVIKDVISLEDLEKEVFN